MVVGGRITLASHRLTLCVVLLINRFFIAQRIIGSAPKKEPVYTTCMQCFPEATTVVNYNSVCFPFLRIEV
jgi:hypothetical protein